MQGFPEFILVQALSREVHFCIQNLAVRSRIALTWQTEMGHFRARFHFSKVGRFPAMRIPNSFHVCMLHNPDFADPRIFTFPGLAPKPGQKVAYCHRAQDWMHNLQS